MRTLTRLIGLLLAVVILVAACRAPAEPAAPTVPDGGPVTTDPAGAPAPSGVVPIPAPDPSGKPSGPSPSIEIPPPID
jgi:hypothetical protein